MSRIIERARAIVDAWEKDNDSDKFLTEFGTWCGKYSRFGFSDRELFIGEVLNEMHLRHMEVSK